jgi:hypothetical protein
MVSLSSAPSLQRDIEAEMKRLKLELKQTMDMYSSACKEAISAKNKVHTMHISCTEYQEDTESI